MVALWCHRVSSDSSGCLLVPCGPLGCLLTPQTAQGLTGICEAHGMSKSSLGVLGSHRVSRDPMGCLLAPQIPMCPTEHLQCPLVPEAMAHPSATSSGTSPPEAIWGDPVPSWGARQQVRGVL